MFLRSSGAVVRRISGSGFRAAAAKWCFGRIAGTCAGSGEWLLGPAIRAVVQGAANDGSEPIVLKNSKIQHAQFSANFHCSNKVEASCPESAMTAPHIAKPVFCPNPWQKISTTSQRAIFSLVFGKNGVFQHNRLRAVVRGTLHDRPNCGTKQPFP